MRVAILVTLAALALVALITGALVYVPDSQVFWITDPIRRFEAENEARRTLGQILLGLAALVGLAVTYYRALGANRTAQAAFASATASLRSAEAAEKTQVTERLTRALEQFGKEELWLRLGAIYALGQVARESKEAHWQVMQLLTAYVRSNAPVPEKYDREELRHHVAPEVQAILFVLGHRNMKHEEGENFRLDLHGCWLTKAQLEGANLAGADLSRCDLRGANLKKAKLQGANLSRAVLGAMCLGANLDGADLRGANLSGADFLEATLQEADLTGAKLGFAHLSGANLKGARLHSADLLEANFSAAQFDGADLTDAVLSGQDVGEANLTNEQVSSAKVNPESSRHWQP